MDVVSPLSPTVAGTERSVSDVVEQLVGLLDETCQDFMDVQQVVGEKMNATVLSDDDVRTLQRLDSATQTVEAVSTVLKNLLACSVQQANQQLDIGVLSQGIKLSHVIQVLQNGAQADQIDHSGEVDLF